MDHRVLGHALTMIDRPTPEKAMELDRILRDAQSEKDHERIENMWRGSEYAAEALRSRYQPKPCDITGLARMPEDTLGGAYGRHMTRHGLRQDFYPEVPPSDDTLYLRQRIYQTHDIMHTLLGYSTSVADETGITGFYLGQQDRYLPAEGGLAMIHSVIQESTVLLHHVLADPEQARRHLHELATGFARGRAAKPFLSFALEEMWERPIADVRADLGITPRTMEV
ncbi:MULTISPECIES: Coq4 family protein [Amycolatopsis]|uniref:Coq4 family protein n=1 Tax=Amycolatopsis TaxID=1813 RepID=UPI000481C566|nr:Coq4 family protein [Amycolatopsis thermoflava]